MTFLCTSTKAKLKELALLKNVETDKGLKGGSNTIEIKMKVE